MTMALAADLQCVCYLLFTSYYCFLSMLFIPIKQKAATVDEDQVGNVRDLRRSPRVRVVGGSFARGGLARGSFDPRAAIAV